MKGIKKLFKKDQGFTLVEIIVVLVILAILAAFTIPTMLGFVNDARGKAYIAEAREVYVAAQAVATEYSATTNIPDTNVNSDPTGFGNSSHGTGLAVSISSYEVNYRSINTGNLDMSPQWRASHQMYTYLSKDYEKNNETDANRIKISGINLQNSTGSRPATGEAAWIVSINGVTDIDAGIGTTTRTGKVTKVVYYRNGYQVTIAGDNASVERY